MATLTKLWDLLCCTKPTQLVVIEEPTKNSTLSPLPDRICQLSFLCCSAKDLHNLALTSKRFRNLTRNDKVPTDTGEEAFRNNRLWFTILQLQTPTHLPYKTGLNYKNLHSLFIIKCYPMKTSGTYSEHRRKEHTFHKQNNPARCTGFLCIEKERSLFKQILNEAISSQEEALQTIQLISSLFPLRTQWDKQGNELRFCIDCKILVPPEHDRNGLNPEEPNQISCFRETADFPPAHSCV